HQLEAIGQDGGKLVALPESCPEQGVRQPVHVDVELPEGEGSSADHQRGMTAAIPRVPRQETAEIQHVWSQPGSLERRWCGRDNLVPPRGLRLGEERMRGLGGHWRLRGLVRLERAVRASRPATVTATL